jgi:tetratricopeptide (TPR) repeat protein
LLKFTAFSNPEFVPEVLMADRITQLKAMLEKEPSDAFCLYGLGMEYARLGQHVNAAAWFQRAIEVDPDHTYAYFHRAKSQEAAGDAAGAQDTLRAGLERAKALGDHKATSEIAAYLDEMVELPEDEVGIDERQERPT